MLNKIWWRVLHCVMVFYESVFHRHDALGGETAYNVIVIEAKYTWIVGFGLTDLIRDVFIYKYKIDILQYTCSVFQQFEPRLQKLAVSDVFWRATFAKEINALYFSFNICYGAQLTIMQPQTAKFMGPTWGPPGSCRPQIWPPMNLAIRGNQLFYPMAPSIR